MWKISLLLISLFLLQKFSLGQEEGHIYVSNFSVDENVCDKRINAIEFNKSITTFIANKHGIAQFNGVEWKTVKGTPLNVQCLKFDTLSNIMFVAANGELGYVFRDKVGNYNYKRVHETEKKEISFEEIYFADQLVCFYSEDIVVTIDRKSHELKAQISAKGYGNFMGILKRNSELYVNVEARGLHELVGDTLKQFIAGKKFKESKILFSAKYNKNKIILGTSDNKIYLFNGKKFEQFASHTEIRKFLEENILWDGINVSDQHFAVSTLTGGCAIIGKNYGRIIHTINYQTGLPDDEIFSICMDGNGGLWMAHEQGLSRCVLDMPIRSFGSFPGLYGNINDVLNQNNKLYVATNEGVFKLAQVKNYREIERLVKEKVRKPVQVKQKKGLFKRSKNNAKKKYKTSWVTKVKKEYALQSIRSKYLKFGYPEDKFKKIQCFDTMVLALSNFGLYELKDSTIKSIISDTYINDVYKDQDTSIFYVATLDGMKTVVTYFDSSLNKSNWKELSFFSEIETPVYTIAQTKEGHLVLGQENRALLCLKDSSGFFSETIELNFPKEVFEPINAVEVKGDIFFVQASGIFLFNENNNSIEYNNIDGIRGNSSRYIINKNQIWIYRDSSWVYFNQEFTPDNLKFLKLFDKIKSLYLDDENNLWVICDEKINRILLNESFVTDHNFKVEIESVLDNLDSSYVLENPDVEYENNSLRFKISAPFYYSPEKTTYQFRVEGLRNYEEWSKWTNNNLFELSALPPGNYTISFRAKNVLSQLSEVAILNFKVKIPFWQSNEFYIIVAAMFLVLVGLGFYISHRRLLRKKRILEEKVKERTKELEEEKNKTEELLLNILPEETAEELKINNKVTPRNYDRATVLFTDFKGFTKIAEQLTPEELVDEIDYCFKEFDEIISKYKIEKIKTIGDAYMCAGGLPKINKSNAKEVINAALEIRDFMLKYKNERLKENRPFFEIRIGLHTGKVVAGVVGIKKYAYDVWGDTVNVASRMESSGEPGRVNISGDTYELVKNDFKCQHRGKIEAKNKGMIDMYFVEKSIT